MNGFKDLKVLPAKLNIELDMDIDELVKQEAKWHKSYDRKFSVRRLQRARKRGSDETTGNSSKIRQVHCKDLHKISCSL